jgi:hypothetical protein
MIAVKSSFGYLQVLCKLMQFLKRHITHHVAPMAFFVPPSALINKNRHDLTLAGFADLHWNGLYLGSLSNDARSDCTDTNR